MSKQSRRKATNGILALFISVLLFTVLTPAVHAAGDEAVKSNHQIYVDGWSVTMTTYNINDSNFVRLRDIGHAIGFDVRFDSVDRTVRIYPSEQYSGDQSMIGKTPEQAIVEGINLPVYVDKQEVTMLAYNIGGNNYVKLRDIGAAVDFSIEWDATINRVVIDTTKPYTPAETHQTSTHEAETESNNNIPDGTVTDYSLQANPAIFDSYFTREKYNADRQRVLDTGTNVNWGAKRTPQSTEAIANADNFFSGISQMSELEKVHSINTFICARITYKSGVDFSGNDFWLGVAYGVCEDYARMFQYICHRAGIPCLYVSGIREPARSSGRHAWNEVYVEGKWQFYDGSMNDSRNSLTLIETANTASTGYTFTNNNAELITYQKEVYIPGSTL